MSTTYTATAPDGTILTRTSKTRTYTHVIAVSTSVAEAREYAQKQIANIESWIADQPHRTDTIKYLAKQKAMVAKLEGMDDTEPAGYRALCWCGREDLTAAKLHSERERDFIVALAV